MSELRDQVAVITGGGRGLGASVAHRLARAGARIAVVDLDADAAVATAAELTEQTGVRVIGVPVDVTDEAAVSNLADQVEDELGPIDVWINNAGTSRPAMLTKMSVSDFDLVLRVHVRGTFLGVREAARRMRARQAGGAIINVTSSAGLQGTIGQVNYASAKGAITAMTKSAAKELARDGIRVNAVAPVAATPMTEKLRTDPKLNARFLAQIPMGRIAEAEEVTSAFLYLASTDAAYVTGQVLCIDGGLYMAS